MMNNLLNRNPPVKAVLSACRKLNQARLNTSFQNLKLGEETHYFTRVSVLFGGWWMGVGGGG